MIILNSKPASSQSNNHSHQKDGENILWMSEADKSCSQIHTHAPLTGRLENWQCFLPLLASQHITQRKLQGINFNYFFFSKQPEVQCHHSSTISVSLSVELGNNWHCWFGMSLPSSLWGRKIFQFWYFYIKLHWKLELHGLTHTQQEEWAANTTQVSTTADFGVHALLRLFVCSKRTNTVLPKTRTLNSPETVLEHPTRGKEEGAQTDVHGD